MQNLNGLITEIVCERNISHLLDLLQEQPEGVKEYELLRNLDEAGMFDLLSNQGCDQSQTLLLFQKHFILFHMLYLLNRKMVQEKSGALHISPLLIKRLNQQDTGTQIGEVDSLGDYYLDLENLESANEDNVNELLDNFWRMYLKNDKRSDALNVLGLEDPVSDKEIVKRYRTLANMHHPDKGGDKIKIQAINEAYAVLIK